MTFDASRLAAVISPLRRALLTAARSAEALPEISDAQIEIIRALPRGTVTSPGELATRLRLGRSTVSNLLGSMERSGLIARRPSAADRRQVEIVAAAAALDYFDRFDRAAARIVRDAVESLDEEDRAALDAALPALERLRDRLASEQGYTIRDAVNRAS